MKIAEKKVSREVFKKVVLTAESVAKTGQGKSKLSFWCTKFLEKNKEEINGQTKAEKALSEDFVLEHQLFLVENASKDSSGDLKVGPSGEYSYTPEAKKLIDLNWSSVRKKIDAAVEPFLLEEITVYTFDAELELPQNIDAYTESVLNGFVFNNPNEFEAEFNSL